jgi:hypothetical protein
VFLKCGKNKNFQFMPPANSGLIIDGDVKDMELIELPNKTRLLLVAINNDSLRAFKINK